MKLNQLTGLILLTLTPFLLSVRSQAPASAMQATHAHAHKAGHQPAVLYPTRMTNSLQTMEQAIAAQATGRPALDQAGGCLYRTGNIALPAANIIKE